MGTNYYLVKKEAETCSKCGHTKQANLLHIGKSSVGWCFALHVIPKENINSLEDWIELINNPQYSIINEYNNSIESYALINLIVNRKGKHNWNYFPINMYESNPIRTWEEFHRINHSEEGPNGLLRHKIYRDCIGHGEGTWDLLTGEFS